MNGKPTVLIAEQIAERGLVMLGEYCDVLAPWREGRSFEDEELRAADAIIVRLVRVDTALLKRAVNLRVIGRHGAGVDNVDLEAATGRGIPVVFTPHANANAVAEHTVLLMLALARNLVAADKAVRESHFGLRNHLAGFELRHKILSVIGYGSIGSKVAEICRSGFGMRILAYDPFVRRQIDGITFVGSLEQVLETADVVTLHLPLIDETHHLLDAAMLRRMKPSASLINTSRGAVIDTAALAEVLRSGHLAGAAIDVFEQEPLGPEHPLMSAPRTVLSPHLASSTQEAQDQMAETVARQVLDVLQGKSASFVANRDVYLPTPRSSDSLGKGTR